MAPEGFPKIRGLKTMVTVFEPEYKCKISNHHSDMMALPTHLPLSTSQIFGWRLDWETHLL